MFGSVVACGVGPSIAAEPSAVGLLHWGKSEAQDAVREPARFLGERLLMDYSFAHLSVWKGSFA